MLKVSRPTQKTLKISNIDIAYTIGLQIKFDVKRKVGNFRFQPSKDLFRLTGPIGVVILFPRLQFYPNPTDNFGFILIPARNYFILNPHDLILSQYQSQLRG